MDDNRRADPRQRSGGLRAQGARRLTAVTLGLAAAGVIGTGGLAYVLHDTAAATGTSGSGSTTGTSSSSTGSSSSTDSGSSSSTAPTTTDQSPTTTSSGS